MFGVLGKRPGWAGVREEVKRAGKGTSLGAHVVS